MMKKKITSLALVLTMFLSALPAASAAETDNGSAYTIITQEEYLQNYADYYGITYQEALSIDRAQTAEIWANYY